MEERGRWKERDGGELNRIENGNWDGIEDEDVGGNYFKAALPPVGSSLISHP